MNKKLVALVAAVPLMVGAFAACGTTGAVSDDNVKGSNATKVTAEKAVAEKVEKKVTRPTFGETYTYKDGLSVKISKPTRFTPSEYTFITKKQAANLKFNVTVINKTGKDFDPVLWSSALQSGDQEMEEIFDSENGLDGSPDTTILDGRQSTFAIGYAVAKPADVVLQVTPDGIDYAPSIWTR